MGSRKLGLKETVAMGIGGMVSGGIFAVLGIAMKEAGNAVPISFLLAGILTLITGYSYVKLTLYFREEGGAFTFLRHAFKDQRVAGIFSWILISGYATVMAMYAYAFGAYFAGFMGWETGLGRQLLSVIIVASLVGLNIMGVKETGFVQNILVYTKTAFLFFIAFVGIYFFNGTYYSVNEFFNEGLLTPISVFAVIFVAYEGFQLICYDYHVIKNVKKNLARAMYISIITAMVIYISVSFMATLHLTPEMATLHREYALAEAVVPFIGSIGFSIVVLVALQSTASGINATLFGTSRLMRRVAHHKELPKHFSYTNKKHIPIYSLLILGGITAAFTFFGSLEEITIFGSIIFLIADGVGNYVNLKFYKETKSKAWIPAMGLAGCVVALPIVIHHLFVNDPGSFATISILFLSLFILNLVYVLKRKKTDQG